MKSPVLMGMKHCGKTTLGIMLADKLRLPFVDLDRYIEKMQSDRTRRPLTIRQIYRAEGKEGFQRLEELGLKEIVSGPVKPPNRAVVALGGGTIENTAAMAQLAESGFFIYLEQSEDILFRRIAAGGIPPFLEDEDPKEIFHRLYEKRTALYRARADAVVPLRGLSPQEGLEELLRFV